MFRRLPKLVCALGFWGCSPTEEPLRIGAAASLSDVLPPLLERAESSLGVSIEAIYGGSGELTAQYRHGAPLDLLFLASDTPIRSLIDDGLMEDIGGPRIANRLVLVGSDPSSGTSLAMALDDAGRIGIGATGVPCGDGARVWLREQGIEGVDAVEFAHVRAVLACIQAGSCDLGFVYGTDLAGRDDLHVVSRRETISAYGFGARLDAPEGSRELALFLADSFPVFEASGFERSSS